MTTLCVHDATLLAIHLGDADPTDAGHASGCVLCRRRLAALRLDLERIARHLRVPTVDPEERPRSAIPFWRLAGG